MAKLPGFLLTEYYSITVVCFRCVLYKYEIDKSYQNLLTPTIECTSVKLPWRLVLKLLSNPIFVLLGKSVWLCILTDAMCKLKHLIEKSTCLLYSCQSSLIKQ